MSQALSRFFRGTLEVSSHTAIRRSSHHQSREHSLTTSLRVGRVFQKASLRRLSLLSFASKS